MVAGRGRHLGLVRGGRSRRLAAVLQPGNTIQLTWRARLEDQLGMFIVELLQARAAALIDDRTRLYLSQLVCDHLRLLPERDPHDRLLGMALRLIDSAPDGAALARFEIAVLATIGVVYGGLVALVQRDFKFVIGYSSVSHMGFVLLGLMTVTTIGLSGAVLQMFSHGVLAGLLFGVAPVDTATFVTMSAAMILIGLLASYLPARRASNVDPMVSLRGD